MPQLHRGSNAGQGVEAVSHRTASYSQCPCCTRQRDAMKALSNRRRYLTEGELDRLIKAARKGRYGQRDAR
jgi:hypothetical protein